MDLRIQLAGLDELLCVIYGEDMSLNALLGDLGFVSSRIVQLSGKHSEALVSQFLEVVHRRLTNDAGKDTYYQILCRRYGLDGEPHEQLSSIAEKLGYSPEYIRPLFEEIIQRCRSKSWQKELGTSLKHIAIAELGKMNERPTREHVAAKLERPSNLRGAADLARLDYESKRDEILKQVQAEPDALDMEYRPILEATDENIAALENEIKTEVLLYGESVSGGKYRASYTQGRVSWDNEGMAKYAANHPVVSLRAVSKE